jgi:hypothetical protein
MLERFPSGDSEPEISVNFTFIHPETDCVNDGEIMTIAFRAINNGYAQVLAENSSQICSCGTDYQLQV